MQASFLWQNTEIEGLSNRVLSLEKHRDVFMPRKESNVSVQVYISMYTCCRKAKHCRVHLCNLRAGLGLLDNLTSLNKQLDFRQRPGMNQ